MSLCYLQRQRVCVAFIVLKNGFYLQTQKKSAIQAFARIADFS
jgi:hypothetical protein